MTAEVVAAPQLEPGVVVHPPQEEGAAWVVRRADDSYLRVGADMGLLLQSLDGVRSADHLAELLGSPWTPEHVGQALEAAAGMELLAGSRSTPKRGRSRDRNRRIRVVPPLTVQFTLVRPERLARRVAPLLRRIPSELFLGTVLLVGAGGLLALALQGSAVQTALGSPQPIWVLGLVFVGTLFITGLHEFGHGLTLARYGGSPSRIGLMLFYLTPVLFCDVSDGWRLPRNQQRVMVALAGIGTQVVIAGLLAVLAQPLGGAAGSASLTSLLFLLSVATYTAGVLNLVPLVKFDGYIALMTHVDEPHLRARAMTDARRTVARLLFGGRAYVREVPRIVWAVPFGLACMVFPLYLIVTALGLWSGLLVNMGVIGQAALACIVGYLAYAAVRGYARMVAEARAAEASTPRVVAGSLLVAGVAAAALTLPSVPYSIDGGYDLSDGDLRLSFADGADVGAIEPGDTVTLTDQGLLTGRSVGTSTVGDGTVSRVEVSLGSLFPISDFSDLPIDALSLPASSVADVADDAPQHGSAVVEVGTRSPAEWIVSTYLAPVFR